ncbi:hypothetical protein DFH28DRAFT_906692, partial [Melampsora americana]
HPREVQPEMTISNLVEQKYKQQAGDSKEFTHLRYAAATCDPDVFTPMGIRK